MNSRGVGRLLCWVLGFAICLAPHASVWAGSRGSCMSAQIPESLELPDGSIHPPGTLTLCASKHSSPVTRLHKTIMNGMPVGYFTSRLGANEESGEGEPVMIFYRDAQSRLHLYGYAAPTNGRLVSHVMAGRGLNALKVADRTGPAAAPLPTVLLSARMD